VKEGEKLRPVLDKLVVYRYGGEWMVTAKASDMRFQEQ
jgi:hypothetical protein